MSDDQPGQTPPAGSSNEMPQWVKDELASVRNEAAQRRVEKNAAVTAHTEALAQVTALTDAKTAAEKAAADHAFELTKLKVALAAKVPGEQAAEFASRLRGSTEDELKADAENALKLFGGGKPARATDPSQGRGNNGPAASTPQSEFAQMLGQLPIFNK